MSEFIVFMLAAPGVSRMLGNVFFGIAFVVRGFREGLEEIRKLRKELRKWQRRGKRRSRKRR